MENFYSFCVLGKHLHAPSIFESHKNASMVIDSQKISIHQRWVWHIIWIKKHPTFYSYNYKCMVGKYFALRERLYYSVLRIFYHKAKPSFHLNRYMHDWTKILFISNIALLKWHLFFLGFFHKSKLHSNQ